MTDSWHQMTVSLINDVRTNGRPTTGPFKDRQILLLTTLGAKSGASRTTPLVYTTDAGKWVIIASKGGADTHPAWYLNLLANPNATIELDGQQIGVTATQVHGTERRRLYNQHAAYHGSFNEYEQKTSREIPVLLLERSAQPGPTPAG